MDKTNELGVELIDSSSKPPPILYKYLSDTQVKNVLENGRVRFTPLSNTNDSFEVSTNFKGLAGPKLSQMFVNATPDQFKEESFNKIMEAELNKIQKQYGIKSLNLENVLKEFEGKTGARLKNLIKEQILKELEKNLVPFFNNKVSTTKFLKIIGKLLCFSLSEKVDINPMWAHYANNHKGFVIAFNTTSTWFKERADGKKQKLLKVNYFDGQIEEPLADVFKTTVSKTIDWAYEREWRTLASEDQIDKVKETSEETIHLINFPPEAIQRIILGERMKPGIENKIKKIVQEKYPHAEIYRIQSDYLSTTMNEIKV